MYIPQLLLLGAVILVGILHTMVPDHWVPIALIARQKKWTRAQTVRAALQAGTGHVVTTLLIALVVWGAGVAIAARFGHFVDLLSSLALIGFGIWIAVGSLLEMNHEHGHHHGDVYHPHDHHEGDEHHSHDSKRTALLLILGSSPMIEGIPAFFAAGKYGAVLIIPMAILFAASTIATYVILCVYASASLNNVQFPAFERYGEVLSGGFIALVGVVFLVWPVL
jgi:ABC-type nickel/cobalt efflux system permease component RcnA